MTENHALVVHPDLQMLSAYQSKLTESGLVVILARDLPTALLAMTQHRFTLCIVSASVAENADGWALAAVLRMCFPRAFVAVLGPDPDLLTLQTAINSGVSKLYPAASPAESTAESILRDLGEQAKGVSATIH